MIAIRHRSITLEAAMNDHPRLLLVSPPDGVTRTLARSLEAAGYSPMVVSDFSTAQEILSTRPELLIAELKLGAYNGLHLAIRAGVQGTPAIVVGDADPVLEAEAKRQQATYLTLPLDVGRALGVVGELLSVAARTRRSPRKQVPLLDAFVNDVPARVLDVSYEGMRLEADEASSSALPESFRVSLPHFNFSCDVQRVWMLPLAAEGDRRSGISCGAELSMGDADTALAWRMLVDALPGLAVTA
jgi:hypothetical protein